MAFVGISNKLRDDVRHTIGKMCEAERNTIPLEDVAYTVQTSADWFVTKAWGENLHLRDQIPQDWKKTDANYARFFVDTQEHGSFGIRANLPNRIDDFPPGYESYNAFSVKESDPSIPKEVKETVEAMKGRAEIEKRWNGIGDQVNKFLSNCKSLNEALKLWPDLEHYIPKEYVERVLEKRTSTKVESKAAEILSSIDTQGVMAAAVIARMSGATV